VAQIRVHLKTLVDAIVNSGVPKEAAKFHDQLNNFLTSLEEII
jgi:hypothetical protein